MLQEILEQSVTQRYPIGMRFQRGSQLYRYSQAAEGLAALARLLINSNFAPGVTGHANEDGFEGDLYANAPIGQRYVDIADTAGRAANFYEGGHLVIYSTTIFHQHYIVRSEAGDGNKVRCWLSEPIAIEDAEVGDGVTAYRSPYSAVAHATKAQVGFESFVGLNLIPVTNAYYFWLLTAGPVCVTPTGVTWPGSAAHLRDIYANEADGTIQPPTVSDPSSGYQRIGYLLSATGGTGSDYGDLWIMLQLDS